MIERSRIRGDGRSPLAQLEKQSPRIMQRPTPLSGGTRCGASFGKSLKTTPHFPDGLLSSCLTGMGNKIDQQNAGAQ